MALKILYLIRHGHYETSSQKENGSNFGSLTEKGKQQADYVADYLLKQSIDKIYASSLPRAKETGQIIATKMGKELEITDLLQETVPSMPPEMSQVVMALLNVKLTMTKTTLKEQLERSEKAFQTYFKAPEKGEKSTTDLIVCHGNIIRYFLCKALNIDINNWIKFDINHGGISKVAIDENGNMRVMSHNETNHIPSNLISD